MEPIAVIHADNSGNFAVEREAEGVTVTFDRGRRIVTVTRIGPVSQTPDGAMAPEKP